VLANSTRLFRDVTALTRPYWQSEERWRARGLLGVIVALNLGLVYVNVLFSSWNNRFYNALQGRDFTRFAHEFGIFCLLAVAFILIAVYQTYLNQMLVIRWRRWLTAHFIDEWLRDRAYYHLQLGEDGADNPDQRIADDLQLFVDATLSLSLGLLSSLVTLASFSVILWNLSGTLEVPVGAARLDIPGYMVWIALAYAAGGTWLTHRIGRPLMSLNFQQQRYEANFRFSLVRLRENTEGVALYRGERDEARDLNNRFADIVSNWWSIMKRQKRLTWFTSGYSQAAVVFPVLAAAPRYFSGAIQLGGLMQTGQAFGQVQAALSWFITAYVSIAQWKATVDRLSGFRAALIGARARAANGGIERSPDNREIFSRGLELGLPDGRRLLAAPAARELQLRKGESVLITGPSGVGKSTLLRAIAGIWPLGHGRIGTPSEARMLFLPQKPYLPTGSLRRVLSYPGLATPDDAAMRDALAQCGLPGLSGCLDETRLWSQQLSPGEQQRIACARALLQRPDWLFLDEATSALDEASEARIYRLLRERLPDTTLVSVGHRSTLARFHERRLDLNAAVSARCSTPCPRAASGCSICDARTTAA